MRGRVSLSKENTDMGRHSGKHKKGHVEHPGGE